MFNDWWMVQFRKVSSNVIFTYWYSNFARLEDKVVELEDNAKMKVLRWHAVDKNGSKKRRE